MVFEINNINQGIEMTEICLKGKGLTKLTNLMYCCITYLGYSGLFSKHSELTVAKVQKISLADLLL